MCVLCWIVLSETLSCHLDQVCLEKEVVNLKHILKKLN